MENSCDFRGGKNRIKEEQEQPVLKCEVVDKRKIKRTNFPKTNFIKPTKNSIYIVHTVIFSPYEALDILLK